MNGSVYLADAVQRFQEARSQCDRALAQVPFERWQERLDPESNSLATLMLHLAGNMLSLSALSNLPCRWLMAIPARFQLQVPTHRGFNFLRRPTVTVGFRGAASEPWVS